VDAARFTRTTRPLPHFVVVALLIIAYVLAGKLGLSLAIVHPSASAVWAPTGIALAALLGLGYRVWPGIFIGAFLVNVTTAGSILTSLGVATGNTLEALVGAYLVDRFANGWRAFDRAPDTFRFAILTGMLATAVSATIGVVSLAAGGFAPWDRFGSIWLTWWLGDLGGALVVAPLLILWIRDPRVAWTRAQVLEAAALFAALIAVGLTVFGWRFSTGTLGNPLAFLCMPLLVWAAYRFDPRVASAALLVTSAIAVVGTIRATRGLERWELNDSLVILQVFLGVASVSPLGLAAVVSERRRVEAAIRGTSEQLREALRELEAFSHSMSHDLRSPLGAILNYSTILEEDFGARLQDDGLRMARAIRGSANSASKLLDQLMQFAWAGRERSDHQRIDMTALARDVQAEVVATGPDAGNVRFELRDLPPARGSEDLLRCVFRNLFSNAIKYTRGRGERHVLVRGEAGERENTYSVSDNGMGFDPVLRETMFEPFQRLSRTQHIEGSGLGLAIVAKIIRNHGGRVWGDSDGTNGARFCFTLPRDGIQRDGVQ
jgi:signal transduction histidine kinase